ncbi:MAG: hypothetical protein FWD57_02190 [Polyangiaceae bacterium]|nr:hypothetical protein [Polyangiaceae bacterium]
MRVDRVLGGSSCVVAGARILGHLGNDEVDGDHGAIGWLHGRDGEAVLSVAGREQVAVVRSRLTLLMYMRRRAFRVRGPTDLAVLYRAICVWRRMDVGRVWLLMAVEFVGCAAEHAGGSPGVG